MRKVWLSVLKNGEVKDEFLHQVHVPEHWFDLAKNGLAKSFANVHSVSKQKTTNLLSCKGNPVYHRKKVK